MGRVLAVLLMLIATASWAEPRLNQPVRMSDFDRAEIRFVQAALAWAGYFDGSLDGVWGPRSQRALDLAASDRFKTQPPRLRQVARLVRAFDKAVERENWVPFYDRAANLSYQVPNAILSREPRSGSIAFRASGNTLELASALETPWDTARIHEHFLRRSEQPPGSYSFPQGRMVVNSARLAGSQRSFYIRSVPRLPYYASVVVQWQPEQSNVVRLIVASIAEGEQAPLSLPEGGALHQAVAALDRPKPAPQPGKDVWTLSLAGAGVYVNNTDILTDAGLLRGCADLRLADGTRMQAVAAQAGAGLAVLTSPRRSAHWLALPGQGQIEPGLPVSILGFARYGRGATEPTRSGARVAGEELFGNSDLRAVLVTGHGQGLSGAPVFGPKGRMLGLVTSAPPRSPHKPGPGRLLLTPAQRVGEILSRQRVLHQDRPAQPGAEPARAVVALFCAT